MSSCDQVDSVYGLDTVRLQNDKLRVSVLPGAGGKIAELTDLRSGRNWLWHNPDIPMRRARYGANFGRELDSGGWDEILMSITPCDLALSNGVAIAIPDHGDVVGQEWSLVRTDSNSTADAICTMFVNGRTLDYRFEREIRLRDGSSKIEVSYSLTNRESYPLPWYWTAHTLLNSESHMRIELPADTVFRVESFAAQETRIKDRNGRWPLLGVRGNQAIDLSRSFLNDKDEAWFAGKVFVRSPDSGRVSVVMSGTAERLSLIFDRKQLPWLGLWINNRGWSGSGSRPHRNLGIEPATTPYDDVADAIRQDAVSWLAAGETRCWSLNVELAS